MVHAFAECDGTVRYFGDIVSNSWHSRSVAVHSHIRIECAAVHAFSAHNFVRKHCNKIVHPSDSHNNLLVCVSVFCFSEENNTKIYAKRKEGKIRDKDNGKEK